MYCLRVVFNSQIREIQGTSQRWAKGAAKAHSTWGAGGTAARGHLTAEGDRRESLLIHEQVQLSDKGCKKSVSVSVSLLFLGSSV